VAEAIRSSTEGGALLRAVVERGLTVLGVKLSRAPSVVKVEPEKEAAAPTEKKGGWRSVCVTHASSSGGACRQ
jgi:hypothetical protein